MPENQTSLTQEQEKFYVDHKGNKCPFCKESQLEGGSVEVGAGEAYQKVECLKCGASWTDLYKLAGVLDESVEEPNNE